MNTVIKEQLMETIFDHHVTEYELNTLFFGAPESYEEYIDGLSHDGFLVDLVRLYLLRNMPDRANKYLSRIKDSESRSELTMANCCSTHS